jgi:3-hydroxybutyrate dehydrogenase
MAGTFEFSGEHVLVTGASHGIGFAVAKAFVAAGANVAILSSTPDIEAAGAAITKSTGRQVRALVCDITDRAAVKRVVGGLTRIDVLVNNAGLELITPIDEPGEEVERTFDRIIDINVKGTYYVTRDALNVMPAGGRIIITSSVWGKSAAAGFSAYVTSKHANIGFMRTLAKELGHKGIRVNAICPGWVETRAAMRSLARMAEVQGRPEAEILGEIVGGQALPGLMQPDDMASLYLFLASPMAANITGQAFNVDRGEVMG